MRSVILFIVLIFPGYKESQNYDDDAKNAIPNHQPFYVVTNKFASKIRLGKYGPKVDATHHQENPENTSGYLLSVGLADQHARAASKQKAYGKMQQISPDNENYSDDFNAPSCKKQRVMQKLDAEA